MESRRSNVGFESDRFFRGTSKKIAIARSKVGETPDHKKRRIARHQTKMEQLEEIAKAEEKRKALRLKREEWLQRKFATKLSRQDKFDNQTRWLLGSFVTTFDVFENRRAVEEEDFDDENEDKELSKLCDELESLEDEENDIVNPSRRRRRSLRGEFAEDDMDEDSAEVDFVKESDPVDDDEPLSPEEIDRQIDASYEQRENERYGLTREEVRKLVEKVFFEHEGISQRKAEVRRKISEHVMAKLNVELEGNDGGIDWEAERERWLNQLVDEPDFPTRRSVKMSGAHLSKKKQKIVNRPTNHKKAFNKFYQYISFLRSVDLIQRKGKRSSKYQLSHLDGANEWIQGIHDGSSNVDGFQVMTKVRSFVEEIQSDHLTGEVKEVLIGSLLEKLYRMILDKRVALSAMKARPDFAFILENTFRDLEVRVSSLIDKLRIVLQNYRYKSQPVYDEDWFSPDRESMERRYGWGKQIEGPQHYVVVEESGPASINRATVDSLGNTIKDGDSAVTAHEFVLPVFEAPIPYKTEVTGIKTGPNPQDVTCVINGVQVSVKACFLKVEN